MVGRCHRFFFEPTDVASVPTHEAPHPTMASIAELPLKMPDPLVGAAGARSTRGPRLPPSPR